jgi:hypothetical protein
MKYKEAINLNRAAFKRLCGVYPETFIKLIQVVTQSQKHRQKQGRPPKISIEDQIMLTLEYLREYRTYFHIAQDWGIHESTAYRIIQKIEQILVQSGEFSLPGQKALLEDSLTADTVVVDVTEIEIERPKKRQKSFYSGKKKRHTLKVQILVEQTTAVIICAYLEKGKKHDFRVFKESSVRLQPETLCLGDRGYQGLANYHSCSQTPHKKRKKQPLSSAQKQENKQLASQRVIVEFVNRSIKIFRIFKGVYRNRHRRLGLRFNLVAGFYNYELTLPRFNNS